MKVMIVEDDALAALSVETALRFCGHQVVGPFASTAEVVRADHGGDVDLVLMDINLEGHSSGLECARVLHKRYGLPVVFISGDGERARSGRDVALGSMTKPISESTIMTGIKAIEQMLCGERPAHLPAGFEVFNR